MNRNKMKMNKNLLIVFAFLLFNLGYGQTINASDPVLASILYATEFVQFDKSQKIIRISTLKKFVLLKYDV